MVLTLGIDVGTLHMAATLAEVNPGQTPIIKACTLCRIGSPKDPMEVLIRSLHATIQARADELCPQGLGRVVCEQQLGMAAPKNFALSAVLYSYYTQLAEQRQQHIEVVFCNPRRKFKVLATLKDVPGVSEHSERIKSTRGSKLKALSIEMATALAKHWNAQVFLDKRYSVIKADDLGDSALMATLC